MKQCYVCGKTITNNKYFEVGPNSYICNCPKCFSFYYWDSLATRLIADRQHKYAIINHEVYLIGEDENNIRANANKVYIIQFNDGTLLTTSSLWCEGKMPKRIASDFPDNAQFLYC
jgi:hypothetical protein